MSERKSLLSIGRRRLLGSLGLSGVFVAAGGGDAGAQDSQASAPGSALRDGIVSVRDFGALGDGTRDDTAAIQKAMDAVPPGGTVYVPPGTYRVTSLESRRPFSLVGAGWKNHYRHNFQSPGWPGEKNVGSVLICEAASGSALSIRSRENPYVNIRDLMMIGPGRREVTGISVEEQIGHHFENLCIANFGTGLRLVGVQEASFLSLRLRGNHVALEILERSINNQFYGLECQENMRAAIRLRPGSHANNFYSGLVQSTHAPEGAGVGIEIVGEEGGEALTNYLFSGFWFEQNDQAIRIVGDSVGRHTFFRNTWASSGGDVSIGPGNASGRHHFLYNDFSSVRIITAPRGKVFFAGNRNTRPIGGQGGWVDYDAEGAIAGLTAISATSVAGRNLRGSLVISGDQASEKVGFGNTPEPDARYFVVATVVETQGDVPAGARNASISDKSSGGFRVHLDAAPGRGNSALVDWIMMR